MTGGFVCTGVGLDFLKSFCVRKKFPTELMATVAQLEATRAFQPEKVFAAGGGAVHPHIPELPLANDGPSLGDR